MTDTPEQTKAVFQALARNDKSPGAVQVDMNGGTACSDGYPLASGMSLSLSRSDWQSVL